MEKTSSDNRSPFEKRFKLRRPSDIISCKQKGMPKRRFSSHLQSLSNHQIPSIVVSLPYNRGKCDCKSLKFCLPEFVNACDSPKCINKILSPLCTPRKVVTSPKQLLGKYNKIMKASTNQQEKPFTVKPFGLVEELLRKQRIPYQSERFRYTAPYTRRV